MAAVIVGTPELTGTIVATALHDVRRRIQDAGADPSAIRVVAVTKGFGSGAVAAARWAGVEDLGENYARELLVKAADAGPAGLGAAAVGPVGPGPVGPGPRWHFLGAPQRNKMASLAPVVALWQGIDRPAAVDRLAVVRPGAAMLVQVNVVGDPAKAGCAPGEVGGLVERARTAGLEVRGLMCVAPAGAADAARRCFATLGVLAAKVEVEELSMGMSDDFEAAVAEGSTMVRLGRVLFGPRPGHANARR